MKSLKIAETRHSIREFKTKTLTEHDEKTLHQIVDESPLLFNSQQTEILWVDNGFVIAKALRDFAGYSGKMIEAPHYLAVLSDPSDDAFKAAGYRGEWIILKAHQLDLGTCWVDVRDSDKAKAILGITSHRQLIALIAIGYGQKDTKLSELFTHAKRNTLSPLTDLGYPNMATGVKEEPTKDRLSVTDFVFLDGWGKPTSLEQLEMLKLHEAIFYMRLAPSYENRQPWRFVIKKDVINLYMHKNPEISASVQGLDTGIAMLYFKVGMHDSGLNGDWEIPVESIEVTDYAFAGRFVFNK